MKRFRYSYKNWIDYLLLIYILTLLFITILLIFRNNLFCIMTMVLNVFPVSVYLLRNCTELKIKKDKLIINVLHFRKILKISDIKNISIIHINNEKIKKKNILFYIQRMLDYIIMDNRIICCCNTFHNGENYDIKIELKDKTNYVVPYSWMFKERNKDIVLKKRQELEEFIKVVMKKQHL